MISNKVRTTDGRWLALDGAYMKKHQRMLGGIYQSVLRNELSHRFGFEWEPIENGQAEIAGVSKDVLRLFSKRTVEVESALDDKIDDFIERQGREPSQWERAALTREAAVDTRTKKTGTAVDDLIVRWSDEAASIGWSWPDIVDEALDVASAMSRERRDDNLTTLDIVDHLTAEGSVWNRADIMKAVCDLKRPMPSQDGDRWAATLEQVCDTVIRGCIGLDPDETAGPRRSSDGRSVWVAPTSRHMTSDRILGEEDFIISWAMDAQEPEPAPSLTVEVEGLDVMQAEVAGAVAGNDRLVLAVGPAGAGKTTTLRTAVNDLHEHSRLVFGVAPSAKAARVLERETGVRSDTLAKLLYEWERRDRPPGAEFDLPTGATVLVDEAGMVGTFALARLLNLADRQHWRLVLIGDHHQLQAVGRGGMFHELCVTGRAIELDRIHRFIEPWEAAASLQLRHGDPRGLDAYIEHDRVIAAPFEEHLQLIASTWLDTTSNGGNVAVTASTNEQVERINAVVQNLRIGAGQLSPDVSTPIGGGERALIGDVVVTRQNDRRLETSVGEPVRNRESWTVAAIGDDGSLTVSSNGGSGHVKLPADYTRQHVRLGYAATEHGNQGDTVTVGIELATVATTQRGLYVGVTRGREDNKILVVTDSHDLDEARDILERVLASDRSDVPATTQRRRLAEMDARPSMRPEPRCVMPLWLNELRTNVGHDLAEARSEFQSDLRRLDKMRDQLDRAKEELAEARAAFEPFSPSLEAAHVVVRTAQEAVWASNNHAMRAKGFKKRSLLREAGKAATNLDDARAKQADVEAVAAPAKNRVAEVAGSVRQIETSIRSAHFRMERGGHEDRITRLLGLEASLDTWERWAHGQPIADADLIDAAHWLREASTASRSEGWQFLAQTVEEWGAKRGVAMTPAAPAPTRSVEHDFGIEL